MLRGFFQQLSGPADRDCRGALLSGGLLSRINEHFSSGPLVSKTPSQSHPVLQTEIAAVASLPRNE